MENNLIELKEKQLHERINISQKVSQTLSSSGWIEYIGPILEKMIVSIIGGKINKSFVSGELSNAEYTPQKRDFYLGYKQGLIDFYNRIITTAEFEEKGKEALKKLEIEKDAGFVLPMTDSPYNLKEENNAI